MIFHALAQTASLPPTAGNGWQRLATAGMRGSAALTLLFDTISKIGEISEMRK